MNLLLKILLVIVLVALLGLAANIFFTSNTNDISSDINGSISPVTDPQGAEKLEPQNKQNVQLRKRDEAIKKQDIPEGVNPIFYDKPETQIAWMERGKSVVIKNKPDAVSADFRNTFFHRGAKARPVTCGEVQFRSEGEAIDDYQRFIYTGIQSSYLEQDVTNFDIFWSMMCEQILDEYFETQDQQ